MFPLLAPPRPHRSRSAFTLLEVLLAIAISAGILAVILFFYQQSEALRARLLQASERIAAVRVIMERLTRDLSAARRCETFQAGLTGGMDNLQFVKLEFPQPVAWTNQSGLVSGPGGAPLRLVTYSVVEVTNSASGGGLVRTDEPLSATNSVTSTNDDLAGPLTGNASRPAGPATEQVEFVRFRYWDGSSWLDSWSTPDLPIGIEISLGVEPLPPELTPDEYPFEIYRRVIYLPHHGGGSGSKPADGTQQEGP